ncbi:MAG TPA: 2Fe-2S iron-sulfur cluster-binding protein [Steroidobacteraceae bacterium]|jgi:ring-1,2-phenylacetyl-CoA epoxidase subunit PaaE|nr:2Fe-2S iron-sulfur cluster-binding protein [Steroidobacteraceae bacterium]
MAALRFHPLKVTAVERTGEDATCVTVEIPAALRETFAHHAGQYVTVQRKINDRDERRTYSIVTAPGGNLLKLGIRRQTGGLVSGDVAANLKAGDLLEVGAPMGRFRTAIDPKRRFSYVAFAAGSGITPVLSLATDILAREPLSRFTLIYGNRSIARSMFLEEVLALKNRHIDRLSLHFVMSREPQHTELLNGHIDGNKVIELARQMAEISSADEYLICGPGDMVDEVRNALKSLNGASPVRFERFATASARPLEIITKQPDAPAPQEIMATVTVTMDGRQRSFPMSPGDASVLEAAERAGLELPFSCRSGICATCRARITAGEAVMTHNIALERWETDAGFVLCCQARPTTPTLDITYDQK